MRKLKIWWKIITVIFVFLNTSNLLFSQVTSRFDHSKMVEIDSIQKYATRFFLDEDYETSLELLSKGIEISREKSNLLLEAQFVMIEAYIYLNRGLAQKAMEKFTFVQRIGNEYKDTSIISGAIHGKGRAYIEMNLYQEAIGILQQGLNNYIKSNDYYRIGVFNNSLGMAYSELGFPEKALEYYENYHSMAVKLNDTTSLIYALVNIGEVYSDMKNYEKGVSYLRKASFLNIKRGDAQAEAAIYGNFAKLFFQDKSFDSSMIFLRQAIEVCNKYNNARFQPENYQLLIKIYKSKGQLDSALYAAELLNKYVDSVYIEDKVNTIQYMNYYFEVEDKLSKSAIIAQQLKNRTILLVLSISAAILFILLLILLFSRFKLRTKLHNQERNKLNLTIDEKNRELVGKVLNQIQTCDNNQTYVSKIDEALLESNSQKTNDILFEMKRSFTHQGSSTLNWENFKVHFEQVHPTFFDKLKGLNNQLTTNDLRHCAYIKMNLSTKEIAGLLNISDRSVQTSRYRIKKKLQLSEDVNLTDFLRVL